MNEETRRSVQDNIDLDKKIDELKRRFNECLVYIDMIDLTIIEKKEHEIIVDIEKSNKANVMPAT